MSRFAEKLQRVYRGAVTSIGFRRSGEEEISQMMIVTSLSDVNAKAAKVTAGTDAAMVSGKGLSSDDIKQLVGLLGDVPLGIVMTDVGSTDIDEVIKAGCDFIVFDIKAPLGFVNKESLGKILRIEPTMDLGMVRAIGGFPLSIDAVLIGEEFSDLTVERLLICQRFADLLDKPLLITVGKSVTSGELSSLCEAGIKGIVVSSSITAKSIAELKRAVSCMPKPTRRKTKATPILPKLSPETETISDEEEEEDI
jgi:hypothetical protein